MGVNTIEVAHEIWQWVLSSVMLSDENQAVLEKWMSGEKSPTFNQLEAFSKKTRVPLGYFFLKTPPTEECKLLEYRTVDSTVAQTPSRDLFDTVRYMENVQEWMREHLVGSGADKVGFVGTIDPNDDAVSVSATIRQILGLKRNWYENASSAVAAIEAKQGFSQKTESGGGDYYRTQATRIDHRFLFALESSVIEGRTLYSDAFRLTNTNRDTLRDLGFKF